MNAEKNFLGDQSSMITLVAVVMLLGTGLSQFFGSTWIMVAAVVIQLVLLFFMARNEAKGRGTPEHS